MTGARPTGDLSIARDPSRGRPTDWSQLPLAMSVEQAAAALGLGRNTCYSLCASGALPVVRLGRRLVIPRQALERLLAGMGTEGLGGPNTETDR